MVAVQATLNYGSWLLEIGVWPGVVNGSSMIALLALKCRPTRTIFRDGQRDTWGGRARVEHLLRSSDVGEASWRNFQWVADRATDIVGEPGRR